MLNRLDSRAAGPPVITEAEYQTFCEYFYRQTGISFGGNKRYFVDKRLIERISETGAGSFGAYFERLRRRDAQAEMERLINLCTINETYFFREDNQFDCLVNAVLPELVANRRRGARIRIWSMPCSTGEEPYSIAIYLLEHWRLVDEYDVEIIASDIDTNVLQAAIDGVYETRSLQRLSRELINRYFVPDGRERFRLIAPIRRSVRFTQVNASDPAAMREYAHIDVIFCRNMLIYFDDRSRLKTVELFYDCLAQGGFICLGHSEAMSRITSLFSSRSFPQAVIYQKCGGPR